MNGLVSEAAGPGPDTVWMFVCRRVVNKLLSVKSILQCNGHIFIPSSSIERLKNVNFGVSINQLPRLFLVHMHLKSTPDPYPKPMLTAYKILVHGINVFKMCILRIKN